MFRIPRCLLFAACVCAGLIPSKSFSATLEEACAPVLSVQPAGPRFIQQMINQGKTAREIFAVCSALSRLAGFPGSAPMGPPSPGLMSPTPALPGMGVPGQSVPSTALAQADRATLRSLVPACFVAEDYFGRALAMVDPQGVQAAIAENDAFIRQNLAAGVPPQEINAMCARGNGQAAASMSRQGPRSGMSPGGSDPYGAEAAEARFRCRNGCNPYTDDQLGYQQCLSLCD